MGSPKKVRIFEDEEERISRLPDELIHKILSFVDAKEAVQTSVLSKRWKLIWTTLPFLNFGRYENSLPKNNFKFIGHVLSNRNHQSHVSELIICVYNKGFPVSLLDKFVEYAISHNVKYLNIDLLCNHKPYKLSTFSSASLEKLRLRVKLQECALESDCWDLPSLTSLHLVSPPYDVSKGFSQSWLKDLWFTGLPALRTLCLDNWDLSMSSFSFSLPDLTTLHLRLCILPRTGWDFPALVTLDMDELTLPGNMSDILATLVNLQNLTFSLSQLSVMQGEFFISCPPQLLNLKIRISTSYSFLPCCNIEVLAPKLCNFTSFGIFRTNLGVPELENVNIRVQGWFQSIKCNNRKLYYRWLTTMLRGLGNAKNLTFDLESFEALNEISTFLKSLRSPFCNLKYVKLPRGYKESNISSALRKYLLSGSPGATFVTTLPQNTLPQKVAVSMTDQNVVLQEPLAAPTKKLDDSQYIRQTLSVHTLNMAVQEKHVVKDFVVGADSIRHADAPVEETDKDQASSSRGDGDFRLWQGHEVNSKFVCLLDCIMHKYPETFEHFTTKNKKLCTMNLNMLCTSLNDFTKISVTDVDSEMIVWYRDVFACLQNQGFNISWVLNRLNYIEHLRFSKPLKELHSIDCHIDDAKINLQELQASFDDAKIKLQDLQARVDDAKSKLQDVQTLRVEKLTEIEKAFGTMGPNLAVGFIGDNLLSSP